MKIKKYFLHILFLVLLIILSIYSITSYIEWNENRMTKNQEYYDKYCTVLTEENTTICTSLEEQITKKSSFFPMFTSVMNEYNIPNGVIMVLFIIIPSAYFITDHLKNRIILSENNRQSYKKSMLNVFKKSYLSILIIPFFLILIFIACYLYTGTFELRNHEIYSIMWSQNTISSPIIFMFLYIINYILICTIYVNCTLAISRKHNNYFLAVILSFLVILGIELFFEIVISGLICSTLFNSDVGMIFNILNPKAFNDTYGLIPLLTFSLIMCILSFIPVMMLYKDKEKLVIDIEKNN